MRLRDRDAWFDVGIEALRDQLHLSRKVQLRCRQRLLALGLIAERYTSGLSPRLLTAVKLGALGRQLATLPVVHGQAAYSENTQRELDLPRVSRAVQTDKTPFKPNEFNSFKEKDTLDCGNPAIKDVGIQHPGVSFSLKQDCTNLQNRTAPSLQTSFKDRDSTYTVLKERIYLTSTYPLHYLKQSHHSGPQGGGGLNLNFPD